MPDPTLPARLRERAEHLSRCAHRLRHEVDGSPWRSLAAEAMRARATEVENDLLHAAAVVDDAAHSLAVAQQQAIGQARCLVEAAALAAARARTAAEDTARAATEAAARAAHETQETAESWSRLLAGRARAGEVVLRDLGH